MSRRNQECPPSFDERAFKQYFGSDSDVSSLQTEIHCWRSWWWVAFEPQCWWSQCWWCITMDTMFGIDSSKILRNLHSKFIHLLVFSPYRTSPIQAEMKVTQLIQKLRKYVENMRKYSKAASSLSRCWWTRSYKFFALYVAGANTMSSIYLFSIYKRILLYVRGEEPKVNHPQKPPKKAKNFKFLSSAKL